MKTLSPQEQDEIENLSGQPHDAGQATDPHAYLVTDSEGNIMGLGPTEADAIEDAAKALEMEPEDVERITDEVARDGYQGDEETLILQTRQVWEETSGMTVEEYLGQ